MSKRTIIKTVKASGSASRASRFATEVVAQWDTDALIQATLEVMAKPQAMLIPPPRASDVQKDHDEEREHGWSVK